MDDSLIQSFDERRDIVILGETAIQFCIDQFVELAQKSISNHNRFAVALSGGTTPKPIYEALSQKPYASKIDWAKVWLFWSDERAVLPNHPDSNYRMTMEAGFKALPIPTDQIFRMQAENHIRKNALAYEKLIQNQLDGIFDLVILGIGEDGHTASLFPKTHGLHAGQRLVVANFIPEMRTWRMTLTYGCINKARCISIYAFGKKKAHILKKVLSEPDTPDLLPIQAIGTPIHKALYIVDKHAAVEL
jgi:6-phosphogluconolactonase